MSSNTCACCYAKLRKPYVESKSALCNQVGVCSLCFRGGETFGAHHKNITMFSEDWTVTEILTLLDLIVECGFGNWVEISGCLKSKSSKECADFYTTHFLNNQHPSLPQFPYSNIEKHPKPIIFKLSDDPPRPKNASLLHQEMAGYSAARGDLAMEYDDGMESNLTKLNCDFNQSEDQLITELTWAVLSIYQYQLRERHRRKKLIRDYGLINTRKVFASNSRYQRSLGHWVEKLRVFMRLMAPDEFTKHLELLKYEKELKQKIISLKELRVNGVKYLRNAQMFETLKERRTRYKSSPRLLDTILEHIQDESASKSWLNCQQINKSLKGRNLPFPPVSRKPSPHLDIEGLPGYEKIDNLERNLCRSARLVPEAYMEFKKLLINECAKFGYLRLVQARTLIKIDVNKTRKVYDFLIQQGYINKEPL